MRRTLIPATAALLLVASGTLAGLPPDPPQLEQPLDPDERYVNAAGDVMAGDLDLQNHGLILASTPLSATGSGDLLFGTVHVCLESTDACGVPGAPGADGTHCWDLDGDGTTDAAEDQNGDGFWNALDCQGPEGDVGPQGPGNGWEDSGSVVHLTTAADHVGVGTDRPSSPLHVNAPDGLQNVNLVTWGLGGEASNSNVVSRLGTMGGGASNRAHYWSANFDPESNQKDVTNEPLNGPFGAVQISLQPGAFDGGNGNGILFSTATRTEPTPSTRMTITQAGDVGIGTTTPGSRLHVGGDVTATGHIYAHSTSHVGDLTEPVVGAGLAPGTVVILDGFDPAGKLRVRPSDSPLDPRVVGVISTNPSLQLAGLPTDAPLAVSGIVPVRVTGAVDAGDLLTSSTVPGTATSCSPPSCAGATLGKALESDEDQDGSVLMLVAVG